jgi:hypothetical protein
MASKLGKYVRRNHLGLVAIFIALGGTAWAAATVGPGDIEKNAVRSKHIKAKQVKPGDVSRKLRDGCPPETQRLRPVCVRPPTSTGNYFQAQNLCAVRRLRVPTNAEAHLLGMSHDVPGVGVGDAFWTDELTSGSAGVLANEDGISVLGFPVSSVNPLALCVTEPREGG